MLLQKLSKYKEILQEPWISNFKLLSPLDDSFKIMQRHEFKHIPCGTVFTRCFSDVMKTRTISCPKCKNSKKQDIGLKTFEANLLKLYGTKEPYIFHESYKTVHDKIKVECKMCGKIFNKTPNSMLLPKIKDGSFYKPPCRNCNSKLVSSTKIKQGYDSFIERLINLYGSVNYNFLEEYNGNDVKILVECKFCNSNFKASPGNLSLKKNKVHYCPKCNKLERSKDKYYDRVLKASNGLIKPIEKYDKLRIKLKHECLKCKHIWKATPTNILSGTGCPLCNKKLSSLGSKFEKSVLKFIKKNYSGEIVKNSRKILDGKEIDIYLPELKMGIECNGLYWHSDKYKDNNYHLDKLNLCHEKGIRLIQIFEDEWVSKKNILKSKIKHILGLNSSKGKIYARKCTIKEIDSSIKNNFLDEYHIQGKDSSKIKLGLFYDEILVSVMTFSKLRICLGQKNQNTNLYELSRFATKRKYVIVGGFSKLLSYFKKKYEFEGIVTYADLRYSSFEGNLYEVNGFKLSHQSKPNYWYFYKNSNIIKREHRFNYRKNNLKKLFPEIYDDKLSEKEIMKTAGYVRIYDCGCLVYRL